MLTTLAKILCYSTIMEYVSTKLIKNIVKASNKINKELDALDTFDIL